jgi:glycine/D-amino acid oxidase-like deaminating enzyme
MARLVMVGGGMVGLGGALLLQRDGHEVTVFERDPGECPDPQRAWERWARRGVSQFRRPHGFLARFTTMVRAEMPDVATAFTDAGALEWNPLEVLPAAVTG